MSELRDLPEAISSAINHDEEALAWGWIRVQRARTGRSTFILVHLLVELFDLIRNIFRMRKVRERSAAAEFPLERNMAMCITSQRILIWKASVHPRRVQSYLGEVPRARIASAELPFSSGAPWQTLVLKTTDGLRIRLRIDAQSAPSFVKLLNPA
jgi:hypothetical protein